MSNFTQVLLFVGAAQGFLLAFGLLTISTNRLSNRILSFLALIWAVVLLIYALQENNFYTQYPHFLLVFDQLILLIFPLFFLYAKYLLGESKSYDSRDLWHFLPVLASVLAHSGFFLNSATEKVNLMMNPTPYMDWVEVISNEVVSLQSIIYCVSILVLVHRYKKAHKDQSSILIKRRINLLQIGAIIVLVFWTISVVGLQLTLLGFAVEFDFYLVSYLSLVILIYLISYISFKNTEVFKVEFNPKVNDPLSHSIQSLNDVDVVESEIADRHSMVTNDRFQKFNELLTESMLTEKHYLNPELSLNDLAGHLNVSRNELSGVINSFQEKNFYEFVNQYRVEEAKRLLIQPDAQKYTMEGIGYAAGFNSKASFYRVFRQFTKKSPSQFLKEMAG